MEHLSQLFEWSLICLSTYLNGFRNHSKVFRRLGLIVLSLFSITWTHVKAQTYPANFSQILVTNGILNPTTMAFAPDGRLFVAQQNGVLKIIKNSVLLPAPFMSLSVQSNGERGLLGIAFDPAFSTNNYVYCYYTVPSGSNNRISRFTANGDLVVPGSEVVVLNISSLSSSTNHNGGTMQFGPDGKLYVGIGENYNAANAQNLETNHGKILRINADGSVPSGNPFTSGSLTKQRIWAYGVRNPYTLSIQPGTGRVFVNDVGEKAWEEVNDATLGGYNFGWPTAEGTSTNPSFTNPFYKYAHGSGIGVGCAITGGAFFNPTSTNYPASYVGKYFIMDYCNGWIDMLTINGNNYTRANFASGIAGSPVCIATSPDGNLYYLSRTSSAVYKITYSGSSLPVINNQPQSLSVSEGNSATFSITATGAGLTYQWRKNSVDLLGANSSSYVITAVSPADQGAYSVLITNATGSVVSTSATLTVTGPNQAPTAIITTPMLGTSYAGGQVITYSGTAADPEQGNLPASSYSWYTLFHHDTHIHPGPSIPTGVQNGSFVIPTSGETASNVYYSIHLIVTDAQGGKDTAVVDILPRTSTITLVTNPPGLQVTIEGQPYPSPFVTTSVEGVLRTIGAVSPQSGYTFSSWSQGGPLSQDISTPVNDATYTANFITTPINSLCIEAESAVGQPKFAPYQVMNSATASGGKYIVVPNGTGNQSSPPTTSIASYSFNINEAGSYYVWLRIIAPTSNDNSVFLSVDNGSYSSWTPGSYATWTWKKWSSKSFAIGSHSLSIGRNEDGMQIDKVYLTKTSSTPTGLGCSVSTREEEFIDGSDNITALNYKVMPNPIANEMLISVNLEEASVVNISLFNILGGEEGVVAKGNYATGEHTFDFKTEHLPAGFYVLKINTNKGPVTKVVIKK